MWNFNTISQRPAYRGGFGGFDSNRADGGSSESRMDKVVNAGIHKAVAVGVAGGTGALAAYKGIPEWKKVAGFDLLGGLALSAVEFGMIYKGANAKAVAIVGGTSTGLLCHWTAVQGTIYGASKSKAEEVTKTQGWDYETDGPRQMEQDRTVRHEPPREKSKSSGGFDVYGGAF